MILTKANFDLARTFLTGTNITAIGQKVLNASVKLQGSAGSSGTFTGSATILGVGTEVTYDSNAKKWIPTTKQFTIVLTCKHSLYIQGNAAKVPDTNGTPKWDDALVSGFQAIKIYYSNSRTNAFGDDLTKTAAIDHVVPIFEENIGADGKMLKIPGSASSTGQPIVLVNLTGTTTADGTGSVGGNGGISPAQPASSWAYDVMILLSKDADLYTFASTPGNCDFQAGVTQKNLTTALSTQSSQSSQWKPVVPVLRKDKSQLAQTGFGMVSEQLLPKNPGSSTTKITLPTATKPPTTAGAQYGRLQYKLATPIAVLETAEIYDQLPGDSGNLILTNTHAFLLECDGGNNSTNSGDSGGGTFAFTKNATAPVPAAVLIAVTSGSGSATAQNDAPNMWDFDNNAITSLGPYYAALFNLRFQNV